MQALRMEILGPKEPYSVKKDWNMNTNANAHVQIITIIAKESANFLKKPTKDVAVVTDTSIANGNAKSNKALS